MEQIFEKRKVKTEILPIEFNEDQNRNHIIFCIHYRHNFSLLKFKEKKCVERKHF